MCIRDRLLITPLPIKGAPGSVITPSYTDASFTLESVLYAILTCTEIPELLPTSVLYIYI